MTLLLRRFRPGPESSQNHWTRFRGQGQRFVVNEIAAIGRDLDLRDAVLDEATRRLAEEANGHKPAALDPATATAALTEFHGLWQTLTPTEQRRLIRLLVERVSVDAAAERVSITFRPTGIATLGADDVEPAAPEPELQEAAA